MKRVVSETRNQGWACGTYSGHEQVHISVARNGIVSTSWNITSVSDIVIMLLRLYFTRVTDPLT